MLRVEGKLLERESNMRLDGIKAIMHATYTHTPRQTARKKPIHLEQE